MRHPLPRGAMLAILCVLPLCFGAALAEQGVSDATIVIGMSTPLHGVYASAGQDMRDAIRASFNQVNAEGGIHGRKLELDSFDDDGEPSRMVANTKTLLSDHHAFALIGYYGDAPTAAALPLIVSARIPLIGAVSGADGLRDPVNRYLFNVRASYKDEIAAMVAQLISLKLTRIAVFCTNDALGKSNTDNVIATLKKYKLAPVGIVTVEPHEDYSSDVNVTAATASLAKLQPQAVLLLTQHKAAAELVLKMKSAGAFPQYAALSTVGSDQLMQLLGGAGRGIGVSQVMPYPWDDTVQVVREYQRLLKADDNGAIFSYSSMEGYVMARVLIEGLKKSGKDLTREKLVDVLNSLDFNPGGYRIFFSSANHRGSTFVELTVTGQGNRLLR